MTDDAFLRHRSYSWVPVEMVGPPLAGRTGLEYFEALRDGALPPQPITATIGWRVEEVGDGRIKLAIDPGDHLSHGGGVIHGGVIATLLDSCMSGAMMTTAPAGAVCSTLQLNIQYLSALRPDCGELFAEGIVTHRGRKVAAAEGRLEDSSGRTYARATATVLITEGRV